jgi:two-component system OmpR family sensor kinase
MSIKARLAIAISLFVAIAFALIGAATVTVTRAGMIDRVDDVLRATSTKAPKPYGHDDDNQPSYAKRATATLFFGPDGEPRGDDPSGFADDPDPLPDLTGLDLAALAASDGEIVTTGAVDGSGHEYRVLVRPMNDGGQVVVAAPLDDVNQTVRTLIMVVVATSVVTLLVVVLVVWFTIRRGLRPIDDMIATAGLIASGDLSHRVEHEDEVTEVGRLGRALNAMLARIETSFAAKEASERRLRQFVADASHELRTPLTSIRGYAELYRSGAAASPAALERVMARIESEGARMGKLVEDLLLLARLDQGRPLQREPVDLVELVEDAVQDARVVDPGRPIALAHPADARVLGDADRLRQVVDNLLANARVHTEPGTAVHVAIAAQAGEVTLAVADEGPGIEPEAARRVFDRFYRVDTSRSRARGGSGLGLAIVASTIEAHGGRVALDSTPGRGTTVTVTLPRAQPAQLAAREPAMATARD